MRYLVAGWRSLAALLCVAPLGALTGCTASSSVSASNFVACTSTAGPACALGSGANQLQLFTEPENGVRPITDAIRAAQRFIWIDEKAFLPPLAPAA